jgi:cytochrome c-type biogenesis protein CcmF
MWANNRRYGGYIAHIGLIALAVGVTASSTFRSEREATLTPGAMVELRGYAVRFDSVFAWQEPHRWVVRADLTAFREGREIGRLDPRLNFYGGREEPITTPAVRSGVTGDLYVNLLAFARNGENASINVILEPLVGWIWVGGFIIALGALFAVLPKRRHAAPATTRAQPEVAAAS